MDTKTKKLVEVGVIGAGLMGKKRVQALQKLPQVHIKWVIDTNTQLVKQLADVCDADTSTQWEVAVQDPTVDALVVSVYHNVAPLISLSALEAGKHVLCEKPLGRTTHEALSLVNQAYLHQRVLKTGFNYRYYPGMKKAYHLIQEKAIGELKYLRMVLGHGARPGYDREWRTDLSQGGGGALLDPGIHCIDLIRWFCGEPCQASYHYLNAFWHIPYEDNAFVTLKFKEGIVASLHTSITEWRNKFLVEIFGTDGCLKVEGRGGSYGVQTIQYTPRWWWLRTSPRQELLETFNDEDESVYAETKEFIESIKMPYQPSYTGKDGLRAIEIIEQIYKATNKADIIFNPLSKAKVV